MTADEFDPVVRAADATDIVYVGEFRHIKGADLLVDAVARLHTDGKPFTLTLAGDGEELVDGVVGGGNLGEFPWRRKYKKSGAMLGEQVV